MNNPNCSLKFDIFALPSSPALLPTGEGSKKTCFVGSPFRPLGERDLGIEGFSNAQSGIYPFIAHGTRPGGIGLTRILMLIAFALLAQQAHSQVVINEFMPDPKKGEPEWIELFNCSAAEQMLSGYTISDSKTPKALPQITVRANEFVILSPDTASLIASRIIAPGTRLFQVKFSSLNNDGDAIVIRNGNSTTLDSVYYPKAMVRKGVSVERRLCEASGTASGNLNYNIEADSCSPGSVNSVTPIEYDASILATSGPNRNNVHIIVTNIGLRPIPKARLFVFVTKGKNKQLAIESTLENLTAGDSIDVPVSSEIIEQYAERPGFCRITGIVTVQDDRRHDNDTSAATYYARYPDGTVKFNEIMTFADSTCAEFVEIVNLANDAVEIGDWTIRRRFSSRNDTLRLPMGMVLEPGNLLAISRDSTIFDRFSALRGARNAIIVRSSIDFNKTEDEIYLSQADSRDIDSVCFREDWFPELRDACRSLEKVATMVQSNQAAAWRMCCSDRLATPGEMNCSAMQFDTVRHLSATPNPFRPDGSGTETECSIAYNFGQNDSKLSAFIYSPDGRKVRTLSNETPGSSNGTLRWDGTFDDGSKAPAGPYVLLVSCKMDRTGDVVQDKIIIVLAK